MRAALVFAQLAVAEPHPSGGAAPSDAAIEASGGPVAPSGALPSEPGRTGAIAGLSATDLVLRREPAAPPSRRALFEVTAQISAAGGARFSRFEAMTDPRVPAVGGVFALSLRLDFLLLRSRLRAWGVGPFASLRADNFADLAPAAGLSVLAPVHEAFPLVFSLGAGGRWGVEGFHPSTVERVFWGVRSFNYTQAYALAIGLFVESRQHYGPTGLHDVDVVAGIDLDFQSLVIPWMALYSWAFRTDPAR